MSRYSRGIVAAGVLAVLACGLSPATAVPPPEPLPLSLCAPNQTFDLQIDNPYYPLLPGQTSVFFGLDEGEPLGLRITVLKATETFYDLDPAIPDVVTRVVEEVEWADDDEDGKVDRNEDLIEVSRNYFAQTQDDTVCYFGEDVKIYEDGVFEGDTTGSWRADDPEADNAPGIFMPGDPEAGMFFHTEAAPDVAEDTAEIIGFGTVNGFADAMEVEDCNPLDPGPPSERCGTKYYAPGVGLIVDGPVVLTKFRRGR